MFPGADRRASRPDLPNRKVRRRHAVVFGRTDSASRGGLLQTTASGGGGVPKEGVDGLASLSGFINGPREDTISFPAPSIKELFQLMAIETGQRIIKTSLGDGPLDDGTATLVEAIEPVDELEAHAGRHKGIRRPIWDRDHGFFRPALGDRSQPSRLLRRFSIKQRSALRRLLSDRFLDRLKSGHAGEHGLGALIGELDPDTSIRPTVTCDQFDFHDFADSPFRPTGMGHAITLLVLQLCELLYFLLLNAVTSA